MKILNLLFAILFIVFAFVQINDPDPVVWILIYGAMAVTCILAAFRQYYYPLLIGLLVIYAAYSFVFFPGVVEWLHSADKSLLFDDIAKMQYPYIEESREFLGLSICMFVLLMHMLQARRRKSIRTEPGI
ncbi:MAG: transmembrane 220 family protein [Chryseosolibacter sp.]